MLAASMKRRLGARRPRFAVAMALLAAVAGASTKPAPHAPTPPLSSAPALAAPARGQAAQPPWTPTREQTYHLEHLRAEPRELRWLGPQLLGLLEKLNRADAAHLGRLGVLVVPDGPIADELEVSPLPLTWGWAANLRKAVVVDQPSQVFGAYECGRLVRWGPVSSGRQKRPTPEGLFHLNWRMRERTSTEDPTWHMTWYFNFDNRRGLAFHQLELPGYPASHACARMLERDARWLYDWGEGWKLDRAKQTVVGDGTPVLVLGSYAFGTPPPWRSLEWLAQGVVLPEDMPVPDGP